MLDQVGREYLGERALLERQPARIGHDVDVRRLAEVDVDVGLQRLLAAAEVHADPPAHSVDLAPESVRVGHSGVGQIIRLSPRRHPLPEIQRQHLHLLLEERDPLAQHLQAAAHLLHALRLPLELLPKRNALRLLLLQQRGRARQRILRLLEQPLRHRSLHSKQPRGVVPKAALESLLARARRRRLLAELADVGREIGRVQEIGRHPGHHGAQAGRHPTRRLRDSRRGAQAEGAGKRRQPGEV